MWLGPNGSLRTGTWWITLTPLFQITDVDSAVDYQLRVIFGFEF